jgi:hypothetical protein
MNSTGNIFDFEQSIMQCWGVVDDLKLLTEQVYDRPQPLTEDELGNILIGMQALYQLKFEKCFDEFEEICKNYHKYRKVYESVERSKDDGK